MFKTKKTQFAIRKLSKGAAAVLLSFGILSNVASPLVSAASLDETTQQVENKPESETDNTENNTQSVKSNTEHNISDTNTSHVLSDGKTESSDLTDEPAIKQDLKKATTVTAKDYADAKVTYKLADGTFIADGSHIILEKDEVLSKDKITDLVNEKLPAGYKLVQIVNLDDIVAKDENASYPIDVIVEAKPHIITPDDVEDPIKDQLRKNITRRIKIELPNGKTKEITQTVTYERNKIVQTGQIDQFTKWEVVSPDKNWAKFNVEQIDGYTSYVDGKLNNVVEEKDVNLNTQDEVVVVSYLNEKYADIKIGYQTSDGKVVKTLDKIDLRKGQTFVKEDLQAIIDKNLPEGYEITAIKNLDDVTADKENKSHVITVTIKKTKVVTTPDDVKDPVSEGLVKHITRRIKIALPNGQTKEKVQTVSYQRNRIEEDGKVSYTGWELIGKTKSWAKFNVEQIKSYTSTVDGQPNNVVEEKDVNCDTQDEIVFVSYLNEKYADIKISYQTSTGEVVKALDKIDLSHGQTFPKEILQAIIDKNLPAGYEITGIENLDDVTADKENKSHVITVTIKKTKQIITPADVENPEKDGFIKNITRTINIQLPNGKTKQEVQTVTYTRNKIVDDSQESWTHWELANNSAKGWDSYKVDQIAGYTSYVDSKLSKVVEAKDVNCDAKDETVNVSYKAVNAMDVKVKIKDKDGKLSDKNLDKIDLKAEETLTLAGLNEKIKAHIPEGYHIVQVDGMPDKDIVASDYPNNASLDITVTIEADEKDAYDYEDGDLIKRLIRHIYVVKPGQERELREVQKVTFVRTKTHKSTSANKSALASRANTNEWDYSDWRLHETEGSNGKWSAYKVEEVENHKAVVKYPKFFDDVEDREIEAQEVEERTVPVPDLENDEDEIREVEVNYVPVKDEDPDIPGGDDKPETPDDPGNDKPESPDNPGNDKPENPTDPEKPTDPENPGNNNDKDDLDDPSDDTNDDTTSSDSSDDVNKPSHDSDNSSDDSNQSNSSSNSALNNPLSSSISSSPTTSTQDIASSVRPLGESEESTNLTSANEELPQSGASVSWSTELAGLISIASAALIGTIGYLIGRKKKK